MHTPRCTKHRAHATVFTYEKKKNDPFGILTFGCYRGEQTNDHEQAKEGSKERMGDEEEESEEEMTKRQQIFDILEHAI